MAERFNLIIYAKKFVHLPTEGTCQVPSQMEHLGCSALAPTLTGGL